MHILRSALEAMCKSMVNTAEIKQENIETRDCHAKSRYHLFFLFHKKLLSRLKEMQTKQVGQVLRPQNDMEVYKERDDLVYQIFCWLFMGCQSPYQNMFTRKGMSRKSGKYGFQIYLWLMSCSIHVDSTYISTFTDHFSTKIVSKLGWWKLGPTTVWQRPWSCNAAGN